MNVSRRDGPMSDGARPVPRVARRATPLSRPERVAWPILLTMAFAHFLNDVYAAFLAPMLPLVVSKFRLSLTLAGLMGTMFNASAALAQPFFGLAADRATGPTYTILGPLLTVTGMGLVGLAPTYSLMLVILLATGVGVASFHPQSFALAGSLGGARRATALSVFVTGGELGYALGPLYVAPIVGVVGLRGTVFAAVPGLIACAFLWWRLRGLQPARLPAPDTLGSDLRQHGPVLIIIWLVAVIRSIISLAFILFLPLLMRERGQSLLIGATAVFLFGGIGAIGGFAGGILSDRLGRRAILAISFLVGPPLLYLFTRIQSDWSLAALALGGLALYLGAPVNVAMAQEMLPRRASLASSMVTGMAWGIAGVSLTLVGAIADRIGLTGTLTASLGLSVPCLVCVALLPRQSLRG